MSTAASVSARPGPVWVDADEYCRDKLLGGAPVPWAEPGPLASYLSRSVALTGADAVLVDVGSVLSTRLTDPGVLAAMNLRTRQGWPLRALLADPAGRALVVDALRTAAAATSAPVVTVLPSPGRWARLADATAGLAHEPPDADAVETAAMYVAGVLGELGDVGVQAVVIDEGDTPADALPAPSGYGPIANIARHLGWTVVVRTDAAPCWPHGADQAISAWIGTCAPAGEAGAWGLVGEYSSGIPEGSALAPRIVRIPRDADPDAVTATVRSWNQLSAQGR